MTLGHGYGSRNGLFVFFGACLLTPLWLGGILGKAAML